jgi:hypothetical protein
MNTEHFRNLSEALTSLILSEIKEKIGTFHIPHLNTEGLKITLKPSKQKEHRTVMVKMLSSELLLIEDNTSVSWAEIRNFDDLLSILEYVEKWEKIKAKDSFKIEWSIHDFEDRASEIESQTNENKLLFDRSKFSEALKILEDYHDYNLGICWTDVDYHLNEYCRFI